MLRFKRFFLADEQSLIPRSLDFADRTYKHGGFLRHPALRVALWRAWYYSDECAFPCPTTISRRPLLAQPDIKVYLNLDQFVPFAGVTSILLMMDKSNFSQSRVITEALCFDPCSLAASIKFGTARAGTSQIVQPSSFSAVISFIL